MRQEGTVLLSILSICLIAGAFILSAHHVLIHFLDISIGRLQYEQTARIFRILETSVRLIAPSFYTLIEELPIDIIPDIPLPAEYSSPHITLVVKRHTIEVTLSVDYQERTILKRYCIAKQQTV